MGYCFDGEDQIDVFLSYASADDHAHNHWVADFERYLTKMVRAELKRRPVEGGGRAEKFRVCRDETGFPSGGSLEAIIDERVRHSQFLFVFLGSGYLNSQWCLSELEIFRKNTDGTLPEVLKRLFLIVLDREALVNLREGNEPATLPRERQRYWAQIRGVTKQALRVEGFLKDKTLLPVYQDAERADPAFHAVGRRVIDDLVTRLVECRAQARPALPMQVEQSPHDIVIGAVPGRLEAVRDEFVRALGHARRRVITESDLADSTSLEQAIQGAGVFLQPFDRGYPIGWSPFAPGGHLAHQSQIFQEAQNRGRVVPEAGFIWWEPTGIPAVDKPVDAKDRSFLDDIDGLSEERRRKCSALELADEFGGGSGDALKIARVWVEWEQSDSRIIDQATQKVREYFDAYCAKRAADGLRINAALKFGKADWEKLEHGLKGASGKKKPLGVVIVYNEHKDLDALNDQGDWISDLDDVLLRRMFPGIFYMRPKGIYVPTDDWGFVRFTREQQELAYDPLELEEFVGNLFDVLNQHFSASVPQGLS